MLVSIRDRDEVISKLNSWMPQLDEAGQRVAVCLYRLLARGLPVSVGSLTDEVGLPVDEAQALLEGWPDVFRDQRDRIIGFWGLSLANTQHHLEVDGQSLYAWCAWDTLFIPEILQKTARVDSISPVTDARVRLVVTPHGIEKVDPSRAVMSFVLPEGDEVKQNIIGCFCHYVHFFSSARAGATWVSEHEGTFLISMEDAFALAKKRNASRYERVLSS